MAGDDYKIFLASYTYAGKRWGFQFSAQSFDDAEGHLSHMSYGTVDGELMGTIPAGPVPEATGLLVCLICWARNTWASVLRPSG